MGRQLLSIITVPLVIFIIGCSAPDTIFKASYKCFVLRERRDNYPIEFMYQEKKMKIERNGEVWVLEGTAEVTMEE